MLCWRGTLEREHQITKSKKEEMRTGNVWAHSKLNPNSHLVTRSGAPPSSGARQELLATPGGFEGLPRAMPEHRLREDGRRASGAWHNPVASAAKTTKLKGKAGWLRVEAALE